MKTNRGMKASPGMKTKRAIPVQFYLAAVGLLTAAAVIAACANGDLSGTGGAFNLQVPIEMTDRPLQSSLSVPTTFNRTQTSLNPGEYDGTVSYGFDVVATNGDSAPATVYVVDSVGTVRGSVTVPASISTETRIDGSFSPNGTADVYRVMLPQTISGNVNVYAARLYVNQQGARRTKIFVPLTNYPNSSASITEQNDDSSTAIDSYSTSGTWGVGFGNYYGNSYLDTSGQSYQGYDPTNTWTFESVVSATTSGGSIGLAQSGNSTPISSTILSIGSTTSPTLVNTSFNSSNTPVNTGVNVVLQAQTSSTMYLYKSALWIKLSNMGRATVPYRISEYLSSSVYNDYSRMKIDGSTFSNHNYTFQGCFNSSSGSMNLIDDGTNDAGIVSPPVIMTVTSTGTGSCSNVWGFSLTDGHRYYIQGQSAPIIKNAFIWVNYF